uniref:Uncharacterized protein n=1 Tax=Cyclophora tenuis TaxID=216820 RepID=A0A7S1D323_CYCTE
MFLLNGFALDGHVVVEEVVKKRGKGTTTTTSSSFVGKEKKKTKYVLELNTPATLWSGKALQGQKADPLNCFLLKAATELMKRAGFHVVASSITYDGLIERNTLVVV